MTPLYLLASLPLMACSSSGSVEAHAADEAPVELGAVAWHRDHDAAFALAREGERPVLLLFQEIPG